MATEPVNRRAWIDVDLGAIRHNIAALRTYVGLRTEVMPVVKCDAYGHGMAETAQIAMTSGIDTLGVATLAEALALRKLFPAATICMLTPFAPSEAEELVLHHIVPMLADLESARIISLAGQKHRGSPRVHLEVDLGMGRGGVLPCHAGKIAEVVGRMPSMVISGMTAHFPCAETDAALTRSQFEVFQQARKAVEASDTRLKPVHCCASASMLIYPEMRLDMVRPGLLTYGIVPDVPAGTSVPSLKPAMALHAEVATVRSLPAGHTIGYGATHSLQRESKVALIPVGYGDGYSRYLSNKGSVLIGGMRAPILGRVCMDSMMVDVTDIPAAKPGSTATLLGAQGEERISVEELARLAETTPHDITTRFSRRVPRNYLNG